MDILRALHREDPSFTAEYDETSNQIVLTGLGELQLEVIRDRIKIEHKLETTLGELKISYRESIKNKAEYLFELDTERAYFKLLVAVEP
jgi:elongation factor G